MRNHVSLTTWKDSIHPMSLSVSLKTTSVANLLHQCIDTTALEEGKLVHHHIILNHGITKYGSLIVKMYCKCGALRDAMAWLSVIDKPHVSLWNIMIQAYLKNFERNKAVSLFQQMLHQGVRPDSFTFSYILSGFDKAEDFLDVMQIHCYIEECGLENDVHVRTALVNIYGKCSCLDDAKMIFHKMPKHDVVTWNVMINMYSKHEVNTEAMKILFEMQQEGVTPNKATFIGLLDACYGYERIDEARLLHSCIIEYELDQDVTVENALLNLYFSSHAVVDAYRTFQLMAHRNVISWTIMISGHVVDGKAEECVQLFYEMLQGGIDTDKVIFAAVLDACAKHALLLQGMLVHSHYINSSIESDLVVGNNTINMYAKCGRSEDALNVFYEMTNRDVVSWTAITAMYAQQGQGLQSLQQFQRMQREGVYPNKVTFVSILDGCANLQDLKLGMQLHLHATESGFLGDVDIGSSFIYMYGKCNDLQRSKTIFEMMPEHNISSWTAMVTVYSNSHLEEEAVQHFNHMLQRAVIPNEVTYVSLFSACTKQALFLTGKKLHACIVNSSLELNVTLQNSLINMYGKCGSVDHAEMVFKNILARNIVSWTSMMTVYAENSQECEVLALYEMMRKSGIHPDKATLICILDSCTACLALAKGENAVHDFLHSGFIVDSVVETSLINLYGKCGSLDDAKQIFKRFPDRGVVSYTVMIALFAQHGRWHEAIQLFKQMQDSGIRADELTFVSVLYACSHSGLIFEGIQFFNFMVGEHHISPSMEHYVCMVDLFGRAGCVDEAECFMNNILVKPTGELLMAFLGACRQRGDVDRAEHYAMVTFNVDPTNAAPYVMLTNIYSTSKIPADLASEKQL